MKSTVQTRPVLVWILILLQILLGLGALVSGVASCFVFYMGYCSRPFDSGPWCTAALYV